LAQIASGLRGAAGLAHLRDCLVDAFGAINRDQLGAFPGEQQRRCAPDAAASAGDDDGFAFEAAHGFLPASFSTHRRLPPCGISNKISNAKVT
jgi:hypothetical protein